MGEKWASLGLALASFRTEFLIMICSLLRSRWMNSNTVAMTPISQAQEPRMGYIPAVFEKEKITRGNRKSKAFCVRKNKESKYVPPALLKAWGFEVDED